MIYLKNKRRLWQSLTYINRRFWSVRKIHWKSLYFLRIFSLLLTSESELSITWTWLTRKFPRLSLYFLLDILLLISNTLCTNKGFTSHILLSNPTISFYNIKDEYKENRVWDNYVTTYTYQYLLYNTHVLFFTNF